MKKLTNSARNRFASCHRAYKISYEDGYRPAVTSEALSFGTAMHAMLEIYWNSGFDISEKADQVVAIAERYSMDRNDIYAGKTLMALFDGYYARYADEDRVNYRTIGAEIGYEAPLMNPDTGATSRTFMLAGKIDAIAEDQANRKFIVEHKTTSQDISPESEYWRKLPIDGQVSGYYVGAQASGYDVDNCLYDVIRKPTIRPYKATPVEQRKYKKDGTLYASCREFDETAEEWYMRLSADIAENPSRYFARVEVARSETDLQDYLYDMWAVAREIADAENNNRWSRNPQSCSVFGTCEYFDVCTGCASLTDTTLFVKVEDTNPELK